MTEQALQPDGRVVGRDVELSALESFLKGAAPRTLVLTGGAGIGKTTLWELGVELGRREGLRVLVARASGAEMSRSSAGLIDLLDGVGADELAALPGPQQRALEVVLLRSEPQGGPPETQAVAVGLLNLLRDLAARGPLLVAVDDLQWLDGASADALAFAVRRLEAESIAFLLATRPGAPSVLERALAGRELDRLEVEHLSLGATRQVLSARFGLALPRSALRRVYEATLGNPLFTIEVGRTLVARGTPAIGEDVPLPESVEDVLGVRVAALPAEVRRVVVAAGLCAELHAWQARALGPPAALDDAVDLGMVVVDGDRVRPAHPLFATVAKSRAQAGERRELHRALAGLATDAEVRALHLALAAEGPDEELASALAAAAASVDARGARHDAVVLAEHALRLTPGSDERTERLLALGGYLVAAGEFQRVTDLISAELDSLPVGPARAQALLLLTDGAVADNDEIRGYLLEAFSESGGDAAVRGRALAEIAVNDATILVARIREAEASALEVLAAGPVIDGELEGFALYVLSWARAMRGRPIDDVRERFGEVSGDVAPTLTESPERVVGQRHTWRGEIEQARALLAQLLVLADERGESYSYVLQRLHVCQLALRVGDWSSAARLLDEWAQSSERVMWPMYERCRALLAAGRGLPEETERWAAKTLVSARARGTQWDRLEALRARGVAGLLTGSPEQAAADFRLVWEHTRREGVDEPGVFPVGPELVEALVELGELAEALSVTERLHALSEEQEHPWGRATVKRCGALIRLADVYDEEAAAALAAAAEEYGALGLPFDRARSLLSLGRAQRRLRKWALARASLEQAAAEFDALGSPGWAEQARAERARVGGRRSHASGELTETERRVVELAADGLANKEIAQSLFVSVRTVEVHLKHAYAKLGIRSRTQLARRLSERA